MSTYYEIVGSLSFPTRATAENALAKLRGDGSEDTVFWLAESELKGAKDLVLRDQTIIFDSKGWASAEPFYSARSLVRDIVGEAVSGRVRVQEGDGDAGTQVDHFGFKPKKSGAAKKKTAAKKSAKKKTTAKKSPVKTKRVTKTSVSKAQKKKKKR